MGHDKGVALNVFIQFGSNEGFKFFFTRNGCHTQGSVVDGIMFNTLLMDGNYNGFLPVSRYRKPW